MNTRANLVDCYRALGAPDDAAAKLAAVPGAGPLPAWDCPHAVMRAGGRRGRPAAWAHRIVAAVTIGRHLQYRPAGDVVQSPTAAAEHIRPYLAHEPVECFAVVMLDARQRVIEHRIVARGSLSQVDVHPREVFRPAVAAGVHAVVLAHNHPSGEAEPSRADHDLTARLVNAGVLVGIPVVDHVIVAPSTYFSMAAHGMLPEPGEGMVA